MGRSVGFIVLFVTIALCGCVSDAGTTTTTLPQPTTTTLAVPAPVQVQQSSSTTSTLPDPTCSDGVKNQGEEGVDCGGPCKACSIIVDKPLRDNVGDTWLYFYVDNDNVTAKEDKNWSFRYNYTGKTVVDGVEYDEYRVDEMQVNETPYREKWGSPGFFHSFVENNSEFLLRDLYSYKSGHSSTLFKYNPPYESLRYPLKVGAKWSGKSDKTWNQRSMNIMTLPVNYTKEIIGQERVTVPAGTFDTFVIRRVEDTWRNGNLAIRETVTSWFSPKIDSSVKAEFYQEVIGPTKKYRAQTNMGDWYFEEYNVSMDLWNYTLTQEH